MDQHRHRSATWEGRVHLPRVDEPLDQDQEWCEVQEGQGRLRLRFHDYAELYRRTGLYEHLFYGLLGCCSPERVAGMLAELRSDGLCTGPLRVLDLGAGNGMLGEELRKLDAEAVLGVDIIEDARVAAGRDRPGVYDDYLVDDLTNPSAATLTRLTDFRPTCLSCVAALGFGDVPPLAYFSALAHIPVGGILAFNIKSDFLDHRYTFGFSELIRRMIGEQYIRFEATRRYQHRRNVRGEPLYYTAIIATKLAEVPESLLVDER
ncbi:MAG: methyltransferase [Deltaproteobacteria bacterium]|nr:methyltransferase [Deltaproteobacteria bacterium]